LAAAVAAVHDRLDSPTEAASTEYAATHRLDASENWRALADSAEEIRVAGPAFTVHLESDCQCPLNAKVRKRLRKLLRKALQSELDREYQLESLIFKERAIQARVSANTSYSRSRSLFFSARVPWTNRVDAAVAAMRAAGYHVLSELHPEIELTASWTLGEMVFAEGASDTDDAPAAAVQETLQERGDLATRLEVVRVIILGLASILAIISLAIGIATHDLVIAAYPLVYSLLALAFLPLVSGRLTGIRNEIAELKERLELRGLLDEEERRAVRLFQLHNLDLKRYYDLALGQRRVIFGLGTFCIALGSGVAVTALILVGEGSTSSQQKLLISGIGAVGAILANFVAVIYLRMFRDTVHSMNTFHNRLVATHHLLFGNLLAARISNPAKRDETLAAMASSIVHVDPGNDSQTT
jgi:hypothetical protein